MCFGRGFVYIGRKSSETYDSTFLFFFSLLSFSVPEELFLKAWVNVFDHNVMAKGEMTFTFS